MKKLTFNADLKERLKNLREDLGPIISDDKMSEVVGGACGGICKVTCSWWCREDYTTQSIRRE